MDRSELRLVGGDQGAVGVSGPAPDRWDYQAGCVEAFIASQVARGFSPVTIENGSGVLERLLRRAARRGR